MSVVNPLCIAWWPVATGTSGLIFQKRECRSPGEVLRLAETHKGMIVKIDHPVSGKHEMSIGGNGKLPKPLTRAFRAYEATHASDGRATRGAR